MKVLLVEDDEYIARVYERAFRLSGNALTHSPDGEQALQDLQTIDPLPDVIIVDVAMPKLDGGGVLKAVKQNPRTANIPVVVLTNSALRSHEKEYIALGAAAFLVKIENTPSDVVAKVSAIAGHGSGEVPAK